MSKKKENNVDNIANNTKPLVDIVEECIKENKYTNDVIAGALSQSGLLNLYENQYQEKELGLAYKNDKKINQTEFDKIINEFLKTKV